MKEAWKTMMLFVALHTSAHSTFIHKTVTLGDPVILPCDRACVSHVEWTKITPDERVVVQCLNRSCSFKDGISDRLTVSSGEEPLLNITSAAYNDMGSYECKCDGVPICDVKLKVLTPIIVRAYVSDQVTLPCYRNTFKDTKDFQWERDDKQVLHFQNGKLSIEEGFEEKFSLSEDGYLKGDLSLIINQVNSSDEGLYRCYVNRKHDEGHLHSYILTVKDYHVQTSNYKDEACDQNKYYYATVVLAIALGTVIFIIGIFFTMRWTKREKKNAGSTKYGPAKENDQITVCIENTSDKDSSFESETLDSPDFKPYPRRRLSSFGQKGRMRYSKSWSGDFQHPNLNPHGDRKKDRNSLLVGM